MKGFFVYDFSEDESFASICQKNMAKLNFQANKRDLSCIGLIHGLAESSRYPNVLATHNNMGGLSKQQRQQ